jgi:hypothetical protein
MVKTKTEEKIFIKADNMNMTPDTLVEFISSRWWYSQKVLQK